MAEIAVWGLFYYWRGCFPDAGSALYFSGVTYTTVGYGDLALPEPWRMLAPSEALIGILMAGLSTGLFFAVIHRLLEPYFKEKPPSEPSDSPEIHV
jgi:RsiW-degrading membrane proteinase PrsW (M82 family)